MRNRAVLLLTMMSAALLLATGVAIAASVTCSPNPTPDDPSKNPCYGSLGYDAITGTFNADYIIGLGGGDTINASSGHDTVYGDVKPLPDDPSRNEDDNDSSLDNDDTIVGANGDDTIYGQVGNDKLYGDFNNDSIDGGEGIDTVSGGFNRDAIKGGAGRDKITGDSEADTVDAADGEVDHISCGTGTDTLKADRYADDTPLDKTLSGSTPLTTASSSCEGITWVRTTTPPIGTTPLTVNFGANCLKDTSPETKVYIKNKGTSSMGTITLSPSITGPNADYFSAPTSPISLAPGASPSEVAVTFTFTPPEGVLEGTKTGSLDFKDEATGKTVATVPLSGEAKCTV